MLPLPFFENTTNTNNHNTNNNTNEDENMTDRNSINQPTDNPSNKPHNAEFNHWKPNDINQMIAMDFQGPYDIMLYHHMETSISLLSLICLIHMLDIFLLDRQVQKIG